MGPPSAPPLILKRYKLDGGFRCSIRFKSQLVKTKTKFAKTFISSRRLFVFDDSVEIVVHRGWLKCFFVFGK